MTGLDVTPDTLSNQEAAIISEVIMSKEAPERVWTGLNDLPLRACHVTLSPDNLVYQYLYDCRQPESPAPLEFRLGIILALLSLATAGKAIKISDDDTEISAGIFALFIGPPASGKGNASSAYNLHATRIFGPFDRTGNTSPEELINQLSEKPYAWLLASDCGADLGTDNPNNWKSGYSRIYRDGWDGRVVRNFRTPGKAKRRQSTEEAPKTIDGTMVNIPAQAERGAGVLPILMVQYFDSTLSDLVKHLKLEDFGNGLISRYLAFVPGEIKVNRAWGTEHSPADSHNYHQAIKKVEIRLRQISNFFNPLGDGITREVDSVRKPLVFMIPEQMSKTHQDWQTGELANYERLPLTKEDIALSSIKNRLRVYTWKLAILYTIGEPDFLARAESYYKAQLEEYQGGAEPSEISFKNRFPLSTEALVCAQEQALNYFLPNMAELIVKIKAKTNNSLALEVVELLISSGGELTDRELIKRLKSTFGGKFSEKQYESAININLRDGTMRVKIGKDGKPIEERIMSNCGSIDTKVRNRTYQLVI